MRNLAVAPRPEFRPARAVRPAVTAAEARQRRLTLVHAGVASSLEGRRFDDPLRVAPARRRLMLAGALLALAATALILDGMFL